MSWPRKLTCLFCSHDVADWFQANLTCLHLLPAAEMQFGHCQRLVAFFLQLTKQRASSKIGWLLLRILAFHFDSVFNQSINQSVVFNWDKTRYVATQPSHTAWGSCPPLPKCPFPKKHFTFNTYYFTICISSCPQKFSSPKKIVLPKNLTKPF